MMFLSRLCARQLFYSSSISSRATAVMSTIGRDGVRSDDDSSSRQLTVTRIYSDEEGESHFGSFTVSMTGSGDIGYLSQRVPCKEAILLRHTPSSYHYSWHNAPCRQFIVNLDGDVEIEVSSGEKRIITQGEVFFVEDITGKGHYSKAVASKPRHSIFIPVPDNFIPQDC